MTTTINGTTGIDNVQNGTITPAKTQAGALPSTIRCATSNGYGSTNTVIRRFLNVIVNQGTDITYIDSPTLGGSFTINTTGVYAISYSDQFNVQQDFGISVNSSQLTTAIANFSGITRPIMGTTAGASVNGTVSITLFLSAGDIVRPHTAGVAVGSAPDRTQFTITRVS